MGSIFFEKYLLGLKKSNATAIPIQYLLEIYFSTWLPVNIISFVLHRDNSVQVYYRIAETA